LPESLALSETTPPGRISFFDFAFQVPFSLLKIYLHTRRSLMDFLFSADHLAISIGAGSPVTAKPTILSSIVDGKFPGAMAAVHLVRTLSAVEAPAASLHSCPSSVGRKKASKNL
jgi:hypothetical protein